MSQGKSFCGPRPKVDVGCLRPGKMLLGDFLNPPDGMIAQGIAGVDLMASYTNVHVGCSFL